MADTLTAPANYIAGEWRPSAGGDTYEKRNPARPDEVVGEFPSSTREDVDLAVQAAEDARARVGARADRQARAGVLTAAAALIEERAEAIAQDMTREMGKPLREARMEAARAAQILRYSAGEAFRPVGELFQQAVTGGPVYTVHRPVGVVGLITPWNFPAAIPVWKLAPALIYGNTDRAQARAGLAAHRPAHRARARRRRAARGRAQRRGRARLGGRHAAGRAPRRARDLVHRLGAGRRGHPRGGGAARQARAARARRPQPADRDGRRRPRRGRPRPPTRARSGRPGRSARRRGGSTCRTAPTTRSATRSSRASRRAGSATRPTPRPRSGRWSTRARWTTCSARSSAGAPRAARCSPAASAADDDAYLVAPTVFEDVADDAMLSCEEVFGPVTSLYRFGVAGRGDRARQRGRVRALGGAVHLDRCRRRSSSSSRPRRASST